MCAFILQRSCAREKRSKKQNDRIGHLVNLIKFWSIWFKDGCLQQGAASGCNRHREQNNRCTLINRVKLYSVRVRDITFWHRVLWHSLTFTVRFLNTTFAFWIPSESLRSLRHSFQRVKSRGSAIAIAVPEFASWIPRRPPQLFPRTLSTILIAVEKLYNRREKRSKYKFSETGNIYISGDDTVVARFHCCTVTVLHMLEQLRSCLSSVLSR